MTQAMTTLQGWAVVLAIAIPFIGLWWWARRHAPLGLAEMDYNVGRRPAGQTDSVGAAPVAHAGAGAAGPTLPKGAVDAPVPANPAALAPPTEVVTAPAATVALPAPGLLPPAPPRAVVPTSALPGAPTAAPATPHAAVRTALATPKPEQPPSRPENDLTTASQAPAAPPESAAAMPGATAAAAPKVTPDAAATTPTTSARVSASPKPVEPSAVAGAAAAPMPTPPPRTTSAAAAASPPAVVRQAAPDLPPPSVVEAPATAPSAGSASAPTSSDDFGRIFGIDAATAAVLGSAGINTYQKLAAADVRNLRQILADAGQSSTDPTTWPQQARFAAGGKWKQLEKMQLRFKGERPA